MRKKAENIADIAAYIRGELTPDKAVEVEERLRKDPVLQRLADAIRSLRVEAVTDEWKALKSAAHALLDRQLHERGRKKRAKSAHKGVTVFDSRMLPIPEGVRPATVDTGHVRYQIGEEYMDVSFYPLSITSFEIIGRFTGAAAGVACTASLRGEKRTYSVEANEFGLFRFPRISSGSYTLEISDGVNIIGTVELEV